VNAVDEHSVARQLALRYEKGWVDAVLTGDENRIRQVCQRLKIAPGQFRIVHAETQDQAASLAARVVNSVPDALLMKGLVNTDKFMHILLNKEYNLFERGNVLSHVCVVENPHYPKLLVVSDVAIIPYPTLEQKKQMILYVSKVAQAMGIARPKVALIAPTEQVLTVLPACTDAAAIMTGRELFFRRLLMSLCIGCGNRCDSAKN
jgi:phosphate butyryltransferase